MISAIKLGLDPQDLLSVVFNHHRLPSLATAVMFKSAGLMAPGVVGYLARLRQALSPYFPLLTLDVTDALIVNFKLPTGETRGSALDVTFEVNLENVPDLSSVLTVTAWSLTVFRCTWTIPVLGLFSRPRRC